MKDQLSRQPAQAPKSPQFVETAGIPPGPTTEAPQPKPTPQMDKQWTCNLQTGAEGEITVGTKLTMQCIGDPVKFDRKGLWIDNRDDHRFSLRLLEVKSLTDTKAELVVTSWAAGEQKIPNPALTDGKIRVGMGDQEINVASVVDPKENPEGKSYGPYAPMTIPWPIWVWLVVAAVAALVSIALWIPVRRSMRKKKLRTLLEQNAIALTPFNHFNKEIRKLLKLVPTATGATWHDGDARTFFRELDSAFRWFLTRELVVHAIDGSPAKVVSEIKGANRSIWSSSRKDLRLALEEMAKAQMGRVKPEDALQIAELCRSLSDKIAKEKGAA